MSRYFVLSYVIAVAAFVAGPAVAADAMAGKKKAATCAVCHGIDGLHKVPDAPNLAGDGAEYIIAQLKAFQAGTRHHEQMSIIAKGLNDDDIANLAAWYSSLVVTVKMPE